jgi:HAE1 family hydrophobic/amphiphilic exporter-1
VGTSGGVSAVLEDRSGGPQQNLTDNVNKFMAALRKRPEIASVITTYVPNVPQIYVDVDRAKAIQEGVSLADVYETLQTFMGGNLVNYFNRFGRQWQTYVEAEGTSRTNIDNINQFYVQNASGNSIPLSALTSVKRITGPEFTMRYNEYEAAQLIANASPGYSSSQATDAFEQVFRETMPREMALDYQGMTFQEQKAAQGVSSNTIFGVSLLFVFLILAAQYESWSLPFSVLLSTPIAVFGGFLALSVRSLENNVYAQIGLVMLIGLAAKNAILIVEFARSEYQSGKTIYDAALAGAQLRLRPILMTAFAFILGCIPLWTASGAGGISRQVLGTVVIGGMLASTLIAIFIVPVTFAVVERLTHRFSTRSLRKETRETVISGDGL